MFFLSCGKREIGVFDRWTRRSYTMLFTYCHVLNKRYDTEDIIKTAKRLPERLSLEEIETLFKGLEKYVELLNEGGKNK